MKKTPSTIGIAIQDFELPESGDIFLLVELIFSFEKD
jgi:hypothetical protein